MRLRDKVANMSPIRKKVAVSALSVLVFALLVWGTVCAMSKQVSIVDEKGEEIRFITYANNTAEVLAEKNVTLGPWDETSIPLDSKVKEHIQMRYKQFKGFIVCDAMLDLDNIPKPCRFKAFPEKIA